ncbi:MAG: NADPH:quinone reductase [Gemmatimonadota bacterium]|nr:NADPH:quinone reductase [Gemmatimonadota bacterium]
MKAIWYERTGAAAEVLEFGDVDAPSADEGEVLVRVATSGVNPSDTKRRDGWIGLEMPHSRIIPHSDGGGVIEAVGAGVSADRIGERVWLWNAQNGARAFGTAAEYTAVPSELAVALPGGVDFATAAGLGVPGCTAHYAVFGDGPVGGQTLLVQGGAGAVGHLAVQLATLGGARVIATVSSEVKGALAREAGADAVVDYTEGDAAGTVLELTEGAGVDRIVEVDLAANLTTDIAVLRENGRIASYSSTSNPVLPVSYYPLAFKDVRIHFLQGYLLPAADRRAAIRDLTTWLAAEQLQVRIGARFPLAGTAAAHEAQEDGSVTGKIIVEIE